MLSLVALPSSIPVNFFCDWLQYEIGISNETRNIVETCLTLISGCVQYFFVVFLATRLLKRESNAAK